MMANPLMDVCADIVAALQAAGFDEARTAADPDAGPGPVVKLPTFEWPNVTGCGKVQTADVSLEVLIVGAGWAPEQIEILAEQAYAAWEAIPTPPYRVTAVTPDQTPDAPAYTLTVEK